VIRLQRSLYGTSMPGAGAVHHIKPGNALSEQIFSAVHPVTDIAHTVGIRLGAKGLEEENGSGTARKTGDWGRKQSTSRRMRGEKPIGRVGPSNDAGMLKI
jgi:hypothetical protein